MIQAIVRFGKLLFKGWMAFAHALGWVNTRILLVLFFFLFDDPNFVRFTCEALRNVFD